MHRLPSVSEALKEATLLFRLSAPMAATALLLHTRSAVSMLFLGFLGDLPLAAGSTAMAYANITGYSVISGLSLGMEPLCAQAFGANRTELLSQTLYRAVLFLLVSSVPISFLWMSASRVLVLVGQDPEIAALAQSYVLFSLPDLVSLSLIHPIRIFLRSQGITRPLAASAALAAAVSVPANLLLVTHLQLGVPGVAAASAATNLALLLSLCACLRPVPPGPGWAAGWGPLPRFAAASCLSVCLEWWWYELVIILCGMLPDPKPAVAAVGVLIQATALLYVFPSSLGSGASARVGNELGANRPAGARFSAAVAVAAASGIGVAAMGLAVGTRDAWGRAFTGNVDVKRLTAAALPIVGLCELGNCPQTVGCGVLRGTARPARVARVNLGAFYLVGMPVAVGLSFGLRMGFCGLWLGLLAAQLFCAALILYGVWNTDWEAQAHLAQLRTGACGQLEKCGQPLVSIMTAVEFET